MSAFVIIEFCFYRFEARAPRFFAVADIDVSAGVILGYRIVMVSQQASQTGVAIEAVAARGIGYDAEIILTAEVIYPRYGGIGPGYNKFPGFVIEVTVTLVYRHSGPLNQQTFEYILGNCLLSPLLYPPRRRKSTRLKCNQSTFMLEN